MIENFDSIFLFLVCLIGCVLTPAFYSFKLWESKSLFKRYNVDDSATQFTRFAAAWPMAESITAILILYYGPEGNWAFFILGFIVFAANLFYNTLSYFNIAFTLGRDKYAIKPEAIIASIFKLSVYGILIIGLSDKIFL